MVASLPPNTHTHTHTQLSSVEQLEPRALLAGLTGGFASPLAATVPLPTGGDRAAAIVLAEPARPDTAGIGTAVVPFQVTPLVLTGAQAAPTIAPAVQHGTGGSFQVVPVGAPGASGGFAPDVDPWAPGGLLPGWEYQVWQEIGLLPPDGLEAPGVADASERPPKFSGAADDDPLAFALDPKTGKLWGYGPRVEGGNAKQAFGQVGGRVNGVLKEVGVITVTEGAPVLAGFWWFITKGDDAVDLARRVANQETRNKLHHIFGNHRHRLADMVTSAGSEDAAFDAMERGAQAAFSVGGLKEIRPGVFEGAVTIYGTEVTVRGVVVGGVFRVGSAWR